MGFFIHHRFWGIFWVEHSWKIVILMERIKDCGNQLLLVCAMHSISTGCREGNLNAGFEFFPILWLLLASRRTNQCPHQCSIHVDMCGTNTSILKDRKVCSLKDQHVEPRFGVHKTPGPLPTAPPHAKRVLQKKSSSGETDWCASPYPYHFND